MNAPSLRGAPLYGGFDDVAEHYVKGRQPYPPEIFSCLQALLSRYDRARIIDLGCGHGLSSRPMAQFATVIGIDPSPKMLEHAVKLGRGPVYLKATTDNLPLASGQMHAATAFSSLHWFAGKAAIQEVRRVLVPGGLFFVANKSGTFEQKRLFSIRLGHLLREPVGTIKKRYRPRGLLELGGFVDVTIERKSGEETYSAEDALDYLLSVSDATKIPESRKPEAIDILSAHIKRKSVDGKYRRQINYTIVTGYAP